MKKLILILTITLSCSMSAFAGHGVERGLVKIDNGGLLGSEITSFISRKLMACASGVANEVFNVMKVKLKKDVVDNGIVDYYYTVDLGYLVNGENMAGLEVKIIDWSLSNYDSIDQKISFEVSQDNSGLCK